MKKTLFGMLAVVFLAAGSVLADGLNKGYVAGDANWVMHTDVSGAINSEMGGLVQDNLTQAELRRIGLASTRLDIDLQKDIKSVTVYGPNANPADAVVLVQVKYNKEKLMQLMARNPGFAQSNIGKFEVISLQGRKGRAAKVVFAGPELIVASQSESSLTKALAVIQGVAPSLATEQSELSALATAPDGSFFMVAANGISRLGGNPVVANIQNVVFSVGELSGNISLNVDITAVSVEAAQQFEGMLLGVKAFAQLKHSDKQELMSLLNSTVMFRNDNVITLTFQYPSELLMAMHDVAVKKFRR